MFSYTTSLILQSFMRLTLWGMAVITFLIIRTRDLKYLVACSSIYHIAPTAPMTLQESPEGIVSSIYIASSHGLISLFLFFIVSVIYEVKNSRNIVFNKSIESLNKIIFFMFVGYIFLNLGIPPFIRFSAEILIISFLRRTNMLM